ncbi:hypothetical protein HYPSUDRAFT_766826 [Hypholoma sublateritium FD-334 SS-4]|uniref:Uncharacterized protein n=1 Tax=Hypholoma sublateritium (strain FD-334 SS-4) TaxID=945553 RepID=A0A0D2PLN7_HYPSF|nr:hypothetical protein HYPSUDRAFT_766826 [Hypholoma sublateritium FD-334 SS-4]
MNSTVFFFLGFSLCSCLSSFVDISLLPEKKTRSQICRLLELPEHPPSVPSYLATPAATPSSLGRRYHLPPDNDDDSVEGLPSQTPERASQRGALLEYPSFYDRPAGRGMYSSLLTPDSTPEHGEQAWHPRTAGTLAPVTPSKSRNPSTSHSSLQSTTAYLETPPPSNRKRAPGSSTAENISPSFSDLNSVVTTIDQRSTGRTTTKTDSQSSRSVTRDIHQRYLSTPTTAGRSSARDTAKREIHNVLNTMYQRL